MIEGKLKEIRQLLDTEELSTNRSVNLALEALAEVVDELFKFMLQIRELQVGSDPGGVVPAGGSLGDLIKRVTDLEVRVHRGDADPRPPPLTLDWQGNVDFWQLVRNLRAKPGLDVADERDRALLWAAQRLETQAPPFTVPVKHGRLKRVDEALEKYLSDDISPAFQEVLDGILQLKLSEAEAVWTALRACDPMTVEFERVGGRGECGTPADFFASAVKAAVGLQTDLKSIIAATAAEAEHVVRLREGLQEVFDLLELLGEAKDRGHPSAAEKHRKDALAKAAALLTD